MNQYLMQNNNKSLEELYKLRSDIDSLIEAKELEELNDMYRQNIQKMLLANPKFSELKYILNSDLQITKYISMQHKCTDPTRGQDTVGMRDDYKIDEDYGSDYFYKTSFCIEFEQHIIRGECNSVGDQFYNTCYYFDDSQVDCRELHGNSSPDDISFNTFFNNIKKDIEKEYKKITKDKLTFDNFYELINTIVRNFEKTVGLYSIETNNNNKKEWHKYNKKDTRW